MWHSCTIASLSLRRWKPFWCFWSSSKLPSPQTELKLNSEIKTVLSSASQRSKPFWSAHLKDQNSASPSRICVSTWATTCFSNYAAQLWIPNPNWRQNMPIWKTLKLENVKKGEKEIPATHNAASEPLQPCCMTRPGENLPHTQIWMHTNPKQGNNQKQRYKRKLRNKQKQRHEHKTQWRQHGTFAALLHDPGEVKPAANKGTTCEFCPFAQIVFWMEIRKCTLSAEGNLKRSN